MKPMTTPLFQYSYGNHYLKVTSEVKMNESFVRRQQQEWLRTTSLHSASSGLRRLWKSQISRTSGNPSGFHKSQPSPRPRHCCCYTAPELELKSAACNRRRGDHI